MSALAALPQVINRQERAVHAKDDILDDNTVTAGISCWDHRSQVKNIEETLTGFLNLVAPLFGLTICRTGKRCFLNVVFLGSVIPGPNPHCV